MSKTFCEKLCGHYPHPTPKPTPILYKCNRDQCKVATDIGSGVPLNLCEQFCRGPTIIQEYDGIDFCFDGEYTSSRLINVMRLMVAIGSSFHTETLSDNPNKFLLNSLNISLWEESSDMSIPETVINSYLKSVDTVIFKCNTDTCFDDLRVLKRRIKNAKKILGDDKLALVMKSDGTYNGVYSSSKPY